MKKLLIISLFCVVLFVPEHTYAATVQDTYHTSLLKLIELLNKQVYLLTEQFAAQKNIERVTLLTTHIRPVLQPNELMSSQYYSGTYTAVYVTNGRELSSVLAVNKKMHTRCYGIDF
jgi:hypothetical protein